MASRSRRQRGHIRPLPSGSFQAIVYAGTDPLTGKENYLRETAPTWDEAEVVKTKLLRQVDENKHPKSDLTVRQAIEQWLEVAKHEETTRDRVDDLIRIYIDPTLGHLKAARLDAETLERWYARLENCREACGGQRQAGHTCRPLSSSTVRKIHYILRPALGRAVRWEQIPVNKVELVEAPPPAPTEPDPPNAAEAARILNEAWSVDPEWGLFLWLTMITGSRRGEASALRWRHVDFQAGVLTVQRSNAQPKSGLKEKVTKSRQQRRVLLDAETLQLLSAHRAVWHARCAELMVEPDPAAYLFSPAPDSSTPWPPRSLTQRYGRFARKLKLRSTRLHSLRHYSATELISAGTDVRTVAGRLGHGSGGATTLRIYAAWVDEAGQRAAATIAGIMPQTGSPAPRGPRGPYEVIAAELREQIRTGQLKPGDLVPTTKELAATHEVSIATTSRALSVLSAEGLIEVSRGRRAVVSHVSS
jgi:integrase